MGLISEVLAHGGFLPQLAELNKKKTKFNKKNGVGFSGVWLMFFLLLTALWAIVDVEAMAAASAVIGFFGAFIIMFASAIFLPSSKFGTPAIAEFGHVPPQHLPGNVGGQALPPSNEVPVSAYAPPAGNWRDTKDLEPGSVTEGTTKLLEHERD